MATNKSVAWLKFFGLDASGTVTHHVVIMTDATRRTIRLYPIDSMLTDDCRYTGEMDRLDVNGPVAKENIWQGKEWSTEEILQSWGISGLDADPSWNATRLLKQGWTLKRMKLSKEVIRKPKTGQFQIVVTAESPLWSKAAKLEGPVCVTPAAAKDGLYKKWNKHFNSSITFDRTQSKEQEDASAATTASISSMLHKFSVED